VKFTTSSVALQNGSTLANGHLGQGLSFDGADDYISVADPGSGVLDFGIGDFSVAGWVKANNLGASNREFGIVHKTSAELGVPGWLVELTTWDGGSATKFGFVFAITNSASWDEIMLKRPRGRMTLTAGIIL